MATQSFDLGSPERIAKLYGGNKQKILQALQSGALRQFAPAPMDQTLAAAAANFIDQVRDAAQAEAAPQQTVFDKLFTPPQPQMPPMPQGMPQMPQGAPQGMPAGLGATPEAAAMPAPAEAMMGASSAQAVPGMAEGGMVPPYASGGGLSDLPVPDDMFDEPSNGGFGDGYRGGGLVAFAGGTKQTGVVAQPPENKDSNEIIVNAKKDDEDDKNLNPLMKRGMMFGSVPSGYGGYDDTLGGNLATINQESPRATKRAEQIQAYYDKLLNPEEQKKRRQEAIWDAVGRAGRAIASTPGSLLQAASAGMGEAGEALSAAIKEQRADERAVQQALVGEERTGNKELMDRAAMAAEMLKGYNVNEAAFQNQNFQNMLTRLGIDGDILKSRIMAGASLQSAIAAAMASRYGSDRQLEADKFRYLTTANETIRELTKPGGTLYPQLRAAAEQGQDKQSEFFSNLRKSFGLGGDDPLGLRGGR